MIKQTTVWDFTITRTVVALVLQNKWLIKHIDVRTAFLNGDIDREIYVRHPCNLSSESRHR